MKKAKILILIFGVLLATGLVLFGDGPRTSIAEEAPATRSAPQSPGQALPDLVLDDFTMTPERPRVNEPVTITIQVRNAGTGDGPGWRVNLYVDPPDQPPTSTTPYSKTTFV